MSVDVDTVLLDRVFQRATDAICEWVSCFDLARSALGGVILVQSVILLCDLGAGLPAPRLAIVVVATLIQFGAAGAVRRQIGRVERQARPGLMNVARITLRPFRMVWLLVAAGSACLLSGMNPGPFWAWSAAVNLLWVCTAYFMSCAAKTPSARVRRLDMRAMAGAF